MKFRSVKTQILVWFGGISFIVLLMFNTAIYYFIEENIKLNIQNTFYDKAVFINNHIVSNTPIDELLKDKKLESFDVAIVKENKLIYKKGDVNFNRLIPFIKDEKSFFVFKIGKVLNGLYIFRIHNPYSGAILFYEKKINTKIDGQLEDIKNALFVLEPLLFFLLLFMVNRAIKKLLRTVRKITKIANDITVTDLSQTIEQTTEDAEIKELVNSFNNMIKRLDNEVEHLEQFNSDVSHELKTPLTVIKGEIEITLNKTRDINYYIKSLKTIENEANTIQVIVENLLMLTKYSKSNIEQTFELFSLDSLLLETIKHFNLRLKQKNIKFNIKKLDSIEIEANSILIGTILSNLIDNAIKYTPKNKSITVSLYKEDKIYFLITDEGIGISQENISKIMNRFYRVDESRNKKIKGFGLGLSIVKNSIELHNGSIDIDSKEGKGTTVTVKL